MRASLHLTAAGRLTHAAALLAGQLCVTQGEQAATRLSIPRLRVRRDWHAGLFPDPNDHRWGTFTLPGWREREWEGFEGAAGAIEKAGRWHQRGPCFAALARRRNPLAKQPPLLPHLGPLHLLPGASAATPMLVLLSSRLR